MAKAAVAVRNVGMVGSGQVFLEYFAQVDIGLGFSGEATIDFANSATAMTQAVKQAVAARCLQQGGPSLSVNNDIVLFGGPS